MQVFIAFTEENTKLHEFYTGGDVAKAYLEIAEKVDDFPTLQSELSPLAIQLCNVVNNIDTANQHYGVFGKPEFAFYALGVDDLSGFDNATDFIEVLSEHVDFVPNNIRPERIIIAIMKDNLIEKRRAYITVD